MNRIFVATLVVLAAALGGQSSALAATCTVSGTIDVETEDEYYCDTNVSGSDCAGWLEKDYYTTTPPIRGARVFVVDSSNHRSSYAMTTESGTFTLSFPSSEFGQSSCSNVAVRIGIELVRGIGIAGVYKLFRIVEDDLSTTQALVRSGNLAFSSGSASVSWTVGETSSQDHLGTVFQIADSALSEIITWNSNMASAFQKTGWGTDGSGMLRIVHDSSTTGAYFDWSPFLINYGWDLFREGATLRHEIGHAVHWEAHERTMDFSCFSYNLHGVGGHQTLGCEYGYSAMLEGMATFLGMRSVYAGNSVGNGWFCFCSDGTNNDQDECTEISVNANTLSDTDRIVNSNDGTDGNCFIGVGDDYSNDESNCVRLVKGNGCNACVGANCTQAEIEALAYRNENQIVRYLWDMIDAHDEGGDDTDETIGSFLDELTAMDCTPVEDIDPDGPVQRDGDCNEPHYEDPADCIPSNGTSNITGDQRGTRDSYNVRDLEAEIDGDQGPERVLNCQQGSDD